MKYYNVRDFPSFTAEWADNQLTHVPLGTADTFALNTTVRKHADGSYWVRYYQTDIMSLYKGVLSVHMEGWHTVTTLRRVNSAIGYTGYSIATEQGIAYFYDRHHPKGPWTRLQHVQGCEAIDTVTGHFFPDVDHPRTGVRANLLTSDRFTE